MAISSIVPGNTNFTNLDLILFSISKTYLLGVVTPNAWKSGFTGGSVSCKKIKSLHQCRSV